MPAKDSSSTTNLPVAVALIERRIYLIRNQKVRIDTDLAQLYGVLTFRLNEAVKRNRKRFPEVFMFQLNKNEAESFDIAICDLKERSRRAPDDALCVYGARRCNALKCIEQ